MNVKKVTINPKMIKDKEILKDLKGKIFEIDIMDDDEWFIPSDELHDIDGWLLKETELIFFVKS